MDITMSDGRQVKLTKIVSRDLGEGDHWLTVWQAESTYPRRKISGTFMEAEHGWGSTPNEAVAQLYDKLDSVGELKDDLLPCSECSEGYRVLSVVETRVPHADDCPAR